MASPKLSRRYAKSLLDLAAEQGKAEAAFNDMELILNACKESKELSVILKSPIVNADKKLAILKEIFGSNVDALTMAFLDLLTKKNRTSDISDIANSYVSLYKEGKGIELATVYSAAQLTDESRAKVLELVKSATDGEVELVEQVDPSLIGGFILRVKDKQIDASISSKIREMRQEFSKNLYINDFN